MKSSAWSPTCSRVPHEIAPLVELALGDAAQRFVVRFAGAVDAVAAAIRRRAGPRGVHSLSGKPRP